MKHIVLAFILIGSHNLNSLIMDFLSLIPQRERIEFVQTDVRREEKKPELMSSVEQRIKAQRAIEVSA